MEATADVRALESDRGGIAGHPRGLTTLAPTIVTLARAEGLSAHAASIEVRLK